MFSPLLSSIVVMYVCSALIFSRIWVFSSSKNGKLVVSNCLVRKHLDSKCQFWLQLPLDCVLVNSALKSLQLLHFIPGSTFLPWNMPHEICPEEIYPKESATSSKASPIRYNKHWSYEGFEKIIQDSSV